MPNAADPTPDDAASLTPADPDELRKALAFALKFNGRKRNHQADGMAADITADHLAKQLEIGGYVVMKKPETPATPSNYAPSLPLKD
jgi:hypothetical protein